MKLYFTSAACPEDLIQFSISVHVQDYRNFFGDDHGRSFDVFDLLPCILRPRPFRNIEEADLSPKRTLAKRFPLNLMSY